jgi:hypothetical protein
MERNGSLTYPMGYPANPSPRQREAWELYYRTGQFIGLAGEIITAPLKLRHRPQLAE